MIVFVFGVNLWSVDMIVFYFFLVVVEVYYWGFVNCVGCFECSVLRVVKNVWIFFVVLIEWVDRIFNDFWDWMFNWVCKCLVDWKDVFVGWDK